MWGGYCYCFVAVVILALGLEVSWWFGCGVVGFGWICVLMLIDLRLDVWFVGLWLWMW